MKISSNSLFHFTGKDVLKSILADRKIGGSYCEEQIVYYDDTESIPLIVPMISFCDIPLETYVSLPGEKYGNFGLGLKKEWGFINGLNPVLYIEKTSLMSKQMKAVEQSIQDLSKSIYLESLGLKAEFSNLQKKAIQQPCIFYNAIDILGSSKELKELNDTLKIKCNELKNKQLIPKFFLQLLEFMKPYEKDLVRGDKVTTPNYRFYDEMEWRYVPNRNELTPNFQITDVKEFNKWREEAIEKRLLFSLKFEVEDIDNIVVEKNSDIEEFHNFIEQMEDLTFSKKDKDILFAKLISTERIK